MEEKKLKENKIVSKGLMIITFAYVAFLIVFGLTVNKVSNSNLIQDKLINPLKEYSLLQQRNIENENLIKEMTSLERNKKTVSKTEPSIQQTPQQPSTNQNSNTQYNTNTTVQSEPVTERKCYRVEIEEDEFKSNKCYSWDNMVKLEDYLFELDKNRMMRDSAESRIEMTCEADTESAREFFKDSCEDAREDKEDAEDKIGEYKNKIREILSKGWD
ncbi:MAG TPA: hypothetical protein PKL88_02480 [bacterium]|mgnify:FL=1|nr:hypothetical protein [bacterium]